MFGYRRLTMITTTSLSSQDIMIGFRRGTRSLFRVETVKPVERPVPKLTYPYIFIHNRQQQQTRPLPSNGHTYSL